MENKTDFNEEQKKQFGHYLNEALQDSLEYLKIKVNSELDLDVGLEYDYYDLLEKFIQHLNMVIKINKELKNKEVL